MTGKQTSAEKREQLRQQELKNNPTGALKDSIDKANNGSTVDFTGNSNWKETGFTIILIVVAVLGYFGYRLLFSWFCFTYSFIEL